jgi:predicted metal-dependent hydrolase
MKLKAKVMLFVTRNFVVDRTQGSLELMRQDGVAGARAWALLLWYLWVRPGMFRKIAGAWLKFFMPGFHPWNEDDRHLLSAYDAGPGAGAEPTKKVRRAV